MPRVLDRCIHAAQCALQLYSRTARSRAARPSVRLTDGVGELLQRAGEASGLRRVVQQALAAVADDRRYPIDRRRDDGKAGGHVLEDLERRPVEAERQRPVRGDVERGDADVGCGKAAGMSACGTAPVKTTLGRSAASSRTAGNSGPSPIKTAPMSVRPRSWSSRIARTRLIAPCQLRNAPAKIATVVAGRSNGAAPGASGRNRSVSAPHSRRTILRAGVDGGRIAALGVTIRSARSQMRSRQRRIGSTRSTRSSRALADPS